MARIDGLHRERFSGFMQAWDLYPLLDVHHLMKSSSCLIDEGGRCSINGVPIEVISKATAQSRARANRQSFVQRVYAHCDCQRWIPFGKLGQHRKACKADITAR